MRSGRFTGEGFSVRHTVRAYGSVSLPASNGTSYGKKRNKKEKEVVKNKEVP